MLLAVAFFTSLTRAGATNINVDCTGATSGAFTSITAALNSLPSNSPTEPNIITVTGPCTENVVMADRLRTTIQAPPGQTTTLKAADASGRVLTISEAVGITLFGFVLQGGETGVLVDHGSQVNILNCTIPAMDSMCESAP